MSSEQKPPINITASGSGKPGSLDPDEDRAKLMEQRYGGKPKSGGGNTNWMPAIVAIVVSVVISAAMVFMFNPTQTGLNTLSDQIVELNNRAVTLEGQVAETNSRLEQFLSTSTSFITQNDLTGITDRMAEDSDVSTLQASLDSLVSENSALADRIDALEIVKEEEEEEAATIVSEDVRWDFRNPILNSWAVGDGITYSTLKPKVTIDHFRVDDEGSYDFWLKIENQDSTLPSNPDTSVSLELTLDLDRGSALLDDLSTYLWTDDNPSDTGWEDVWLDWEDGDFTTVTKGDVDITRKVKFETESFSIPSLPSDESVEFDLVLELYYE